jgi:hypothetical protein
MSSGFSNTDTGDKPADTYTQANKETGVTTQDKIEALDRFVNACKFGMMTTREQSSGKLVSRCMALAAKVSRVTSSRYPPPFHHHRVLSSLSSLSGLHAYRYIYILTCVHSCRNMVA